MADDGFGHLVHIPSLFIDEEDGNKMKQAIDGKTINFFAF